MSQGLVRRVRWLPYLAEPRVRVGDLVEEDTPIAQIPYLPGKINRINAGRELCVHPASVSDHMLVQAGEVVAAFTPLAAARHHWTWSVLAAPQDGAVAWLSRHLGYVYFREPVPLASASKVRVNVARALNVPPTAVRKFLTVQPGQAVYRGQCLASRWVFGQTPITVESPAYGRISAVDSATGEIEIAPMYAPTQVLPYVRGTVTGVTATAIEITGFGHVLSGAWGLGGETWGRLGVVRKGPESILREEDIGPADEGKVLAGAATATLEALSRCREVGVRGLFLSYLPMDVLKSFAGPEPLLPGAGRELGLTVVLKYGFLPACMPTSIYDLFLSFEGQVVSLDGTTQVRAGARRPELVIITDPHRTDGRMAKMPQHPQKGDQVIVLSPRHFGLRGRIAETMEGTAARLPSGVQVRVARLETKGQAELNADAGDVTTAELAVPYDNLWPEE